SVRLPQGHRPYFRLAEFPGLTSSGSATTSGARVDGLRHWRVMTGPAAGCRAVGIKPTYGRVSRRGAVLLSWALDYVQLLTYSVEDSPISPQVLAGRPRSGPSFDCLGRPSRLT